MASPRETMAREVVAPRVGHMSVCAVSCGEL